MGCAACLLPAPATSTAAFVLLPLVAFPMGEGGALRNSAVLARKPLLQVRGRIRAFVPRQRAAGLNGLARLLLRTGLVIAAGHLPARPCPRAGAIRRHRAKLVALALRVEALADAGAAAVFLFRDFLVGPRRFGGIGGCVSPDGFRMAVELNGLLRRFLLVRHALMAVRLRGDEVGFALQFEGALPFLDGELLGDVLPRHGGVFLAVRAAQCEAFLDL